MGTAIKCRNDFRKLAAIALGLLTTGCALSNASIDSQPNATQTGLSPSPAPMAAPRQGHDGQTLAVVTTFLPVTNFVQAVAGDRARLTQLLPPGVTPHDYQAKPQDAKQLAAADMLIINGLDFERFVPDLIASAGNSQLAVVDTSEGIAAVAAEQSEGTEEAESAGEHSHQHDPGAMDPHIWLDPKRAIQQVENIRDALIAADPAGADLYTANAAAYIGELETLDRNITSALAPYRGKTFVTYHDFAAYFAQSYGLKVEYLVNVPEASAAPADVKRVIDTARLSNLKTLLSEPQSAGNPFEAIAQDLGVQVSFFDPLETSDARGLTPDYYLQVMAQNLANLEAAFAAGTAASAEATP